MKIYTKKGDTGETSLLGGTRVAKHHRRIEAYGTIDELNSVIGMVTDHVQDERKLKLLKDIQDRLFTVGSLLSTDPAKTNVKVPQLHEQDIEALEQAMDEMNEVLPELKNFVLPGGNPGNSVCHLARCVCRRAERLATALAETEPVDLLIIKYLNRLSDFLFVLSRWISYKAGAEEVYWKPRNS